MNRSAGRLIISDHKDFISIHLTHFTTIDCMLLLSCESVNYYTKKNRERIESWEIAATSTRTRTTSTPTYERSGTTGTPFLLGR